MAAKQIEKEYVSLSTIAAELDCSVRTVQRWANRGLLPAVKFFGRTLVEREEYVKFKAQNAIKKGAG